MDSSLVGADVDVLDVDADVVDVDEVEKSTLPVPTSFPLKELTDGNVPVSTPRVASVMNLRKIVAGKLPPVTRRPRTDVIGRPLPSG